MSARTFFASVHAGLRADHGGAVRVSMLAAPGESVVPRDVALAGPEHVIRLHPDQLLQTWPPADLQDADPDLWPFIEFTRPDLPWLLGRDSLPWLALLVLPEDEAALTERAGRQHLQMRPGLHPSDEELERRAHAEHVGDTPEADLTARPERWRSRLLWSGPLSAHTRHVAVVVPALWRLENAPDIVPIFHLWRFMTGGESSLRANARKLSWSAAFTIPALLRFQKEPGETPHYTPARFLSSPLTPPAVNPAAAACIDEALAAPMGQTPAKLLPPRYGEAFAPKGAGAVPWLAELNRDPGYRLAASVGASMVRRYQDELVERVIQRLPAGLMAENAAKQAAWMAAKIAHRAVDALDATLADAPMRRTVLRSQGVTDQDAIGSRLDTLVALARKTRATGKLSRSGAAETPLAFAEASPVSAIRAMSEQLNASMASLASALGEPASDFAMKRSVSVPEELWALNRVIHLPPTELIAGSRPDEVLARVTLLQPLLRWFVEGWPELIAPSLASLPQHSITICQPDPAFVAAVILGLNHELGRELAWRRVPVDPAQPILTTFWRDGSDEHQRFLQALARPDASLASLAPSAFSIVALRSPLVAALSDLRVCSLHRSGAWSVASPALFTQAVDAGTVLVGLVLDPTLHDLGLEESARHGTRFSGEDNTATNAAEFAKSHRMGQERIRVRLGGEP